ncbi:hypothetical protein BJ165DRAFT_1615910 [Panaeolus papilionaceus]|nr:hypothetical protein BJ165DRAFT_1615910 [Panaeolus papilionaceus]
MSSTIDYTPVEQSRQASYLIVSSLAIYVYDIFYTLPDEVEYIWRARWSLPKVLYLGVRYWGIFIVAAYAIGSFRALIFARHDFPGAETVIQFAITGILVEEQTRNMHLVDSRYPLLGCLGKVQHRTLLLALINWVPYFISSGVFFIMTVYKLRPKSKTGSIGSVTNPLPLHEGFLKGGALCFLTVTVTIPIGASVAIGVKTPLAISYIPWLRLALSFAGCRLILTLRRAGIDGRVSNEETIMGMETWEAAPGEPIAFRHSTSSGDTESLSM